MGRGRGQTLLGSASGAGRAGARLGNLVRRRGRSWPDEAFVERWGVASCATCGRTIVLGEPAAVQRSHGRETVVCPECMGRTPALPDWIAPGKSPDVGSTLPGTGRMERAA